MTERTAKARVPRRKVEHLTRQQHKVRSVIQNSPETYQAGTMGLLGIGVRAIQRKTGLRPHQITYRLHRAGVKISDYRNGEGPVVDFILNKARSFAEEQFVEQLREKLNLQAVA